MRAHWIGRRANLISSAHAKPPVLMAIITRRALVDARVDALHKARRLRCVTIVKHKAWTRWIASENLVNLPLLLLVDVDADIHRETSTETKAKHDNIFEISNRQHFPAQHIGDLPEVAAQIHIGSSCEKRIVHEENTVAAIIEKLSGHIVHPSGVGALQPAVSYK